MNLSLTETLLVVKGGGEQGEETEGSSREGSVGRVSYFIKLSLICNKTNSHDGCQALVWEIVYKYELKLISLHSALHQLHLTGPLPLTGPQGRYTTQL